MAEGRKTVCGEFFRWKSRRWSRIIFWRSNFVSFKFQWGFFLILALASRVLQLMNLKSRDKRNYGLRITWTVLKNVTLASADCQCRPHGPKFHFMKWGQAIDFAKEIHAPDHHVSGHKARDRDTLQRRRKTAKIVFFNHNVHNARIETLLLGISYNLKLSPCFR